jgi:hypothetical protein
MPDALIVMLSFVTPTVDPPPADPPPVEGGTDADGAPGADSSPPLGAVGDT